MDNGYTYIGEKLPEGVDEDEDYSILEEINGNLYHKNTFNLFAFAINKISGRDVLVEKKPYEPENEHMMEQFIETAGGFVVGEGTGKIAGKFINKIFSKSSTTIKPLGKGHTGRYTPNDLAEQLTLKEVQANPELGRSIISALEDSRWKGWTKMQYIHNHQKGEKVNRVVIHYVAKWKNGKIVAVDDFKFK